MKIHIHTPSFFPTLVGMTYATHVHATLLKELGADVTVVAPAIAGPGNAEPITYGLRRFDISGSGMPWSRLRGDVDALLAFNASERPDIVIAEGWFTTGSVLLPRLRQHARHVVLASHGSADLSIERPRLAHIVRSLAYRWEEATRNREIIRQLSAAIILSSWEDRYRFRDVTQLRKAGIPLYLCPNSSTYTPVDGHALPDARTSMLHVGEMKPHKSPETAVRTMAALPDRYHLTLAFPQETPHLAKVVALADTLGVRDRLHFVIGRKRSELEAVMTASDLLLITSPSKDVQPIVAVDALAKGVPFVSSDVGCMREFGGGIVAAPGDMPAAVLKICGDATSYAKYSHAACEYRDDLLSPNIARLTLAKLMTDLDA